jgi:hypothetical protein
MVGISELDSAPLAETVFPWGTEDAGRVLAETVGLRDREGHEVAREAAAP